MASVALRRAVRFGINAEGRLKEEERELFERTEFIQENRILSYVADEVPSVSDLCTVVAPFYVLLGLCSRTNEKRRGTRYAFPLHGGIDQSGHSFARRRDGWQYSTFALVIIIPKSINIASLQ